MKPQLKRYPELNPQSITSMKSAIPESAPDPRQPAFGPYHPACGKVMPGVLAAPPVLTDNRSFTMKGSGDRAATELKFEGLLLVTAAIWGLAFVAQRAGMRHVGPFTFNVVRFAIGSLVLVPLVIVRSRSPVPSVSTGRRERSRLAVLAGMILFLGASLQQVGIVSTTAGKAGFITGLYVVMVPMLGLLRRTSPGWAGLAGSVLSAAGLYLLSAKGAFRIGVGDGLVLASAFFFALHVLFIDHASKKARPIEIACIQFAVCSFLSLPIALVHEQPTAQAIGDAAIPIAYAGFLSTGVAYTLQVVSQRHVPPTPAAVIMSLEAVFAALGGWIILKEGLSARGLWGCALMLAGMITAQLGKSAQDRGDEG